MIRHLVAATALVATASVFSSCSPTPEPDSSGTTEVSATAEASGLVDKATVIVDQMMAGDYASVVAGFDATMTAAMPESLLATTIMQLQQQAGAFKERTETRQAQEAGYDVVFVTTVFEKATLNSKIVFDDAGKIAGLFFLPI